MESGRDRISAMDIPLLFISAALCTTLVAWASGWTVYPFGILVLGMFLIARLLMLASRKRE